MTQSRSERPILALIALLLAAILPQTVFAYTQWSMGMGPEVAPPYPPRFGNLAGGAFSLEHRAATRWSIAGRIAYLRSSGESPSEIARPYSGSIVSPYLYETYETVQLAPLSLGARFYPSGTQNGPGGLFLELAPQLVLDRLSLDPGTSQIALFPGFQVGGGFQIPTGGGSALELGFSYFATTGALRSRPTLTGYRRIESSDRGYGTYIMSAAFRLGLGRSEQDAPTYVNSDR